MRFDFGMLDAAGLGSLPVRDKHDVLAAFRSDLEVAVGLRLGAALTDSQLDQFDQIVESGDPDTARLAREWLHRNAPDHQRVVEEVFGELFSRLRQSAPAIASACGAA